MRTRTNREIPANRMELTGAAVQNPVQFASCVRQRRGPCWWSQAPGNAIAKVAPMPATPTRRRAFYPFALLMLIAIAMIAWKALVDGNAESLLKAPSGALQQVVQAAQPIIDSDSDHEAVRVWLRRNLDDPNWDEVEWSPAVSLEEQHLELVNRLADEA